MSAGTQQYPLDTVSLIQLVTPSAWTQVPYSKDRVDISFLRDGLGVRFEECYVTRTSLNAKTAQVKLSIRISKKAPKSQRRNLGLKNQARGLKLDSKLIGAIKNLGWKSGSREAQSSS